MKSDKPSAEQAVEVPVSQPGSHSRRKFMTGLALGVGLAPLSTVFRSRVTAGPAAAANDLCYSTAGPLLTPNDFSYLGYYDVQTNGQNTTYSRGLAMRYVNGDLRFMNLQIGGDLHEFSLAGKSFGQVITNTTNRWDLNGTGIWDFVGFWYEQATNRLWSVTTVDYTNVTNPVQIFTRTLNDNGTVSNIRGPVGLQGINAKRVYGGAMALPAWFRQQYGVGPYAVGFGGYTSLMEQGGGVSMGPAVYAIPDPANFGDGAQIPTGQFKTLSDYGPSGNRGKRITIPINYYDGGDPRQNPNTPPTSPPLASAGWLSPGPDGLGWWVWGDHYEGATFIDGPNKSGVVMLAQVATGKAWYMTSTLNSDGRGAELHIYNPASFGAVANGQAALDSPKPSGMKHLPEVTQRWQAFQGNGTMFSTAYDSTTRRLYILCFAGGGDVYTSRLHVYQVAA